MVNNIFDTDLSFLMSPERRVNIILDGLTLVKYPDLDDIFYFKGSKWMFDVGFIGGDTVLWLNHYTLIKPLEKEFNLPELYLKDIVTDIIVTRFIKRELISLTEMDRAAIKKIENDLKRGNSKYINK